MKTGWLPKKAPLQIGDLLRYRNSEVVIITGKSEVDDCDAFAVTFLATGQTIWQFRYTFVPSEWSKLS